jgi:hypothetical protein
MEKNMRKLDYIGKFSFYTVHEVCRSAELLKFSNRRAYCREQLRLASKKYGGSILNYSISDKCLHFIMAGELNTLTDIVRHTVSTTAINYQNRFESEGPFWKKRCKLLLVQNGIHLLRMSMMLDRIMIDREICLYPGEWKDAGYNELTGIRKRYIITDIEQMALLAGFKDQNDFREWYIEFSQVMAEQISGNIDIDIIKQTAVIGDKNTLQHILDALPRNHGRIETFFQDDNFPTFAIVMAQTKKRRFMKNMR